MKNSDKNKSQLLRELTELQRQLQQLQPIKDKYKKTMENFVKSVTFNFSLLRPLQKSLFVIPGLSKGALTV
jgi:hypothetical protein